MPTQPVDATLFNQLIRQSLSVQSRHATSVSIDIGVARLVPDVNVAAKLQIDDRRKRPKVEFNFGLDRLRVDLASQYRLPADTEIDARLLQALNKSYVGIVVAMVARFECFIVLNDFGSTLMEYDCDLSAVRWHAILGQRIEIAGDGR